MFELFYFFFVSCKFKIVAVWLCCRTASSSVKHHKNTINYSCKSDNLVEVTHHRCSVYNIYQHGHPVSGKWVTHWTFLELIGFFQISVCVVLFMKGVEASLCLILKFVTDLCNYKLELTQMSHSSAENNGEWTMAKTYRSAGESVWAANTPLSNIPLSVLG